MPRNNVEEADPRVSHDIGNACENPLQYNTMIRLLSKHRDKEPVSVINAKIFRQA